MKKITGRPKGQNKTSRLEIMLHPEVKQKFTEITKKMGSNPSVKINEMIIQFINQYGDERHEK